MTPPIVLLRYMVYVLAGTISAIIEVSLPYGGKTIESEVVLPLADVGTLDPAGVAAAVAAKIEFQVDLPTPPGNVAVEVPAGDPPAPTV